MTGRVNRRLLRVAALLVFAVAAFYALGGSQSLARLRARIRAMMEPPTPREMQVAVANAQRQAAIDSATRAITTKDDPTQRPATLGFMAAVIGGAVALVAGFALVSARTGAKRG